MTIEHVKQAVAAIRKHTSHKPMTGIILGTGLGNLLKDMNIQATIQYDQIPYFPISTVESHHGKLLFGDLCGKDVVVMQGRFHYYEGYTLPQITFPVRVMHALGIRHLFISNAAGSLNPDYEVSDIMIIRDHINLIPGSPLHGPHDPSFGPRFPDMSDPWHEQLIHVASEEALQLNIRAHTGVYVAVPGPHLETPAEYNYLRIIGGDAVGMSTIPENIVARQMGISCFGASVITDIGVPGRIEKVTIEKVLAAAGAAEPKLIKLMEAVLKKI